MKLSLGRYGKRDVRDACRLAVQSASAAVITLLAMRMLQMPERFVGLLSAVLVIDLSVGSTLKEASERLSATLVGSLIGLLSLLALPAQAGTYVALGSSMLVINAVAAFRPQWRYGVVAAVALALRSENEAMQTATDRALAIGLGALVGVVVAMVVWPDKAENRALRHIRAALNAVAEKLDLAVGATHGGIDEKGQKASSRYHAHIGDARSAAAAVRLADDAYLIKQIEEVERLYNAVIIVNRVAEEEERLLPDAQNDLRNKLDQMRKLGCESVRCLAENSAAKNHLEKFSGTLKEVRASVANSTRDAIEKELHLSAMVFGLDEVQDSLQNLTNMRKASL